MLSEFFLAASQELPETESLPVGFILLQGTGSGGSVATRCREAFAALASGGSVAIALPLGGQGRLRRMRELLSLLIRLARAKRILIRCRATSVQRYGVTPDL